jgi:hypothetical protein
VGKDSDFQKRVQRIGELVHELDAIADPAARSACKGLVQSLMELHGQGLERILEIVFQSEKSGAELIDELGRDSLVSSLLILYGLHPDDLQTRVERKLREISSKLYKMGAEARLIGIQGAEIRLRASVNGHACGSTTKTVRATLEEAVYEAAPDLSSLAIEGLEEPAASGFVGLEKLAGPSQGLHASPQLRSDGMD